VLQDAPPAWAPVSPVTIARVTRGLTRAQLAARARVSTDTISRIESGSAVPHRTTAHAVAVALDWDEAELFPAHAGGES
jgi:DNA-binding XRE family transcriptional regulator